MTTFFEPINVSATHIYHSALELSHLSSIVRRLYYHQRHTPFPRVVAGIVGSWNDDTCIRSARGAPYDTPFTWSPCSQLMATGYPGAVEIRNPLTSELLSTLVSPDRIRALAYSPDGRTLAALSFTSLIIWDIQTGGVAKQVECGDTVGSPLVWSLDGRAISTILRRSGAVQVYDVDLGTMQSLGTLQSSDKSRLWAHDKAFRVMKTRWDGQARTVDIYEARSVLTKIESFRVGSFEGDYSIRSLSPATYRISAMIRHRLHILDIRNSEILLEDDRDFDTHSFKFSSDGSLFAGFAQSSVWIWKYGSGRYTLWRTLSCQSVFSPSFLQFSPASSSIMGLFIGALRVWRLDGPPGVVHPDRDKPLDALSDCGTYVSTGHWGRTTVTITNLLSQAPSQFIDTDMEVCGLVIIGNVLLVMGHSMERITAWQLGEEGVVDVPSGDRSAGRSGSIWTMRVSNPLVSIGRRTAMIKSDWMAAHHFDIGTRGVLDPPPPQTPPYPIRGSYYLLDLKEGRHSPLWSEHDTCSEEGQPVPVATLEERWVKGAEGRHRLWIPPAWESYSCNECWLHNRRALWLNSQSRNFMIKL